MSSNSDGKSREQVTRFDLATLEGLTTHELAELLSNFVLLLRRLPDVSFSDLGVIPAEQQQTPDKEESSRPRADFVEMARNRVNGLGLPGWTGKD